MPACSNPPNRPPRDVVDRLIDEVAWAKTCLLIAAATAVGSPDRDREMALLRQAVVSPRSTIDAVLARGQDVPQHVIVELCACELAIPKLEAGAVLRPAITGEGP